MRLLTRDIPPRAALAVVALALLASVVAGREKPSEPAVLAAVSPERKAFPEKEEQELDLGKLRRQLPQPGAADPFAPRSFAPAPPKVANAPPPKPTAPPLPFTYLGKVIDEGKTVVFVARADENYALEAGQTVAGTYHVDRITDAAVTFTYLPMKTRQTLTIPKAE